MIVAFIAIKKNEAVPLIHDTCICMHDAKDFLSKVQFHDHYYLVET